MGYKHGGKGFNIILGIEIPDLFIKLMSCNVFFKNINYFVILKCPKRMLEYYFSKGFAILGCNVNNLSKLPNEVKQRIHAEETDNSDYGMTCIRPITSTSNTLKKLSLNKSLHSSYIQKEFNEKEEMINNIFSSCVEPLLKYINHPALLKNGNSILMLQRMKNN